MAPSITVIDQHRSFEHFTVLSFAGCGLGMLAKTSVGKTFYMLHQ